MGRWIPLLSLLVLLAACASEHAYEGPERDDAQLAFVLPENQQNRQRDAGIFGTPKDGGRTILRINGHKLGKGRNRFAVLPGRIVVEAIYLQDRTPYRDRVLKTRAVTLAFQAAAGHAYAVRGRATFARDKAAVTLWVVDGTTGRSVASVAVPESHIILQKELPDIGQLLQ